MNRLGRRWPVLTGCDRLPSGCELLRSFNHRADVPAGASVPQPIDAATVDKWLKNLFVFLGGVSSGHAMVLLHGHVALGRLRRDAPDRKPGKGATTNPQSTSEGE
jgi:hypothetical protein